LKNKRLKFVFLPDLATASATPFQALSFITWFLYVPQAKSNKQGNLTTLSTKISSSDTVNNTFAAIPQAKCTLRLRQLVLFE